MKKRTVVLGTIAFCLLAWGSPLAAMAAQGAPSGLTFDDTLETLRQSVAALVQENQQLNTKNVAMRAKIKALNESLKTLQNESRRLDNKRSVQEVDSHKRMSAMDTLKGQADEIDGSIKDSGNDAAVEVEKLKKLEQDEKLLQKKFDALNADISAMDQPAAGPGAGSKDVAAAQGERDRLQKLFYDAANRLQAAKKEWQDMNALVTTGPGQAEALRVERDNLQRSVAQAESDLAKTGARLAETQAALDKFQAEDYSSARAQKMAVDVKDMAERSHKLEDEIQARQKARDENIRNQQAQREALRKEYSAKQEALFSKNEALRREIATLRKNMVALDKKKAALESRIYNKP